MTQARPRRRCCSTSSASWRPQKRAIACSRRRSTAGRTYFQAQLRFTFPSRDRLTSFVALRVDAERLRTTFFPKFVAREAAPRSKGPTGFPPLDVTVLDSDDRVDLSGRRLGAGAVRRRADVPAGVLRARAAALIAPTSATPETWRVRTGYGNQTIPDIIAARARPQRADDGDARRRHGARRLLRRPRAARELRVAEMKSSFVSSVSHDLKTPLALIQLFAETLELGRLKNTDRAQEYYRIINSEARKLTRLINNLLDFSKIEAGLRSYKKEPVEPDRADARRARVAREPVPAQPVHRRRRSFDGDVPVLIDREAAVQAIENLISNAMKYSPEHREITVEVDRDGRLRRRAGRPTAASACRRGCRARSSASSTGFRPTPDRGRKAPASGSPSSTT